MSTSKDRLSLRGIANPSVGILLFAFAFLGFAGHRSVDAAESTADVDCIWISAAELAGKPMSGPAWDALEAAANGDHGLPDVGAFDSKHDTLTLAVALVYARTGDAFYRTKARDAILSAIGTESTTVQAVQPCRNVVSYVISADLIDLSGLDPLGDTAFRAWIDQIRFVVWPDGSMIEEDSERANNHGRMCGMSRAAAIAVYLEDWGELDSTAQVFAGFLGDRQTYDDFAWKHELSWQNDETNPVGINPVGSEKQGLSIDGALPEEMRRRGPFAIPPIQTGYPWEALQGILVEAVILDRAGYAVFDWSDQAILRSVEFVERLDTQYPQDGWWATGDDTWSPWLINAIYQTDFQTEPAAMGKCMGWTDWTHAPDVAEPTPVPAISRRGLSLLAGLLVASGTFCLMPVGRSSSMRNRATRSRTRSGLPSVGKPHIRHLMRKV